MLEVKTTGQCGHIVARCGWNINEAVASVASEEFTRWLHQTRPCLYSICMVCPHQTAVI